jgi:FAD/FMN-containing dehydrogenase
VRRALAARGWLGCHPSDVVRGGSADGGESGDPLARRLRAIVGDSHVLDDPALMASYTADWTGRWQAQARLVVRPGTVAEVSRTVVACAAVGAPLVPQGGNTGLVAGAVPVDHPDAVVLSLRRLAWLGSVDAAAGQVAVGAGATLAAAQRHVRAAGWDLGIDLAARDLATVGGAVATNAGGERVLRYGTARAQVVDVEAVLADGRILSRPRPGASGEDTGSTPTIAAPGVVKDSVGYDLAALLAGSEGTLAILTAVRLRLVPLLPARVVALLGVNGAAEAQRVLGAARARVASLTAAELIHSDGLALVCAHTGLPAPLGVECPAYLLLECAGHDDPTDALAAALADVPEVRDAAVASDAAGSAALWRYREAHPEAINASGVPLKLDVAVPPAVLPAAEDAIRRTVAAVAPGAQTILFGHIAEANVHVNVLGADGQADSVADAVLRTVAGFGGSISAEHGVGRAKARWLALSRSPVEIAAMRAIKSALDPGGLLNPGVLLPAH